MVDEKLPEVDDVPTPAEQFWVDYNSHSEFPISAVLSVLLHVVVGAVIVFVLFGLMNGGYDRSTPQTRVISLEGGDNDRGEGIAGDRNDSPLQVDNKTFTEAFRQAVPVQTTLPEIKINAAKVIQTIDPSAIAISEPAAISWGLANQTLLRKLNNQAGAGNKAGTPGSTGKADDSPLKRSLRWVLRFKTAGGQDYINQVAAMGAKIAVPMLPKEEELLLFEDVKNPTNRHVASREEIANLAGWVKFSDVRRESVKQVAEALKLDFQPRSFWAFFPKSIEEELARKETGFANRRVENIAETVFNITIRGGTYEATVCEQKAKR